MWSKDFPSWSIAANDKRQSLHSALENLETVKAVQAQGQAKYQQFLAGLEIYKSAKRNPYNPKRSAIWACGSSSLYDYGGDGQPVLLVPSLINKAHIFHLSKDSDFVAFLKQQGFHVFLLDWGVPTATEQHFALADYIQRLTLAYQHLPIGIHQIGYCIGGLLAMAGQCLASNKPGKLICLATPWNFEHAASEGQRIWLRSMMPSLQLQAQASVYLPVDSIQGLLATIDPFAVLNRYCDLALAKSDNVAQIVRLEDWLNDGLPLAWPAAQNIFQDFYLNNMTISGWQLNGHQITPPQKTLVVSPKRDKVVPPTSAKALPASHIIEPDTGHIGMVAGRRSKTQMWQPAVDWLHSH